MRRRALTQQERVLRALRKAGPRGVTPADFRAPWVCDDGKPIARLGARIFELRNQGHRIVKAARDSCDVYVLVRRDVPTPPVTPVPAPAAQPPSLFEPAAGSGCAIFDFDPDNAA